MTERIGSVTLDYSRYPGEDFYCDGSVEDELLQIVKQYPAGAYGKVIEERKEWPVLYHLSAQRENIVDWLPIDKQHKVLEVGSGCGAITGALAAKAGSVTCVDLSKKRSLINAYRHSDCENVTIHVGNFKDIEPDLETDYDYICLIGVFEYGQSYIGGQTPFEDFLKILLKHLKPQGHIVIAIENKYGLKYFAGCKEDHLGTYFSGIENYAQGGVVRTFGRNGLEKIFKACGVEQYHFYYPYPDYKFMTSLYSDGYLPKKGELSNNLRNFDRDRMLLFHEKDAYDGMLAEDLFPTFSNSYVAVLGSAFAIQYARYSNDRAPQYQIRTQIDKEEDGGFIVSKYAASKEAALHVSAMERACRELSVRYEGSGLKVCKCRRATSQMNGADGQVGVSFEYTKGQPLSGLLDRCLEQGDARGFQDYIRQFQEKIGYGADCKIADIDPAFSNVLIDGDTWTLIDYEWTVQQTVPVKELVYRALYCYLLEDPSRGNRIPGLMEQVLLQIEVSQEDALKYQAQEAAFQQQVTGNARAMAQLRDDIGYRIMEPQKWIDKYQDSAGVNRVQIYEDNGSGYSEENSYFVQDAYQGENLIDFTVSVGKEVKTLRIDPAMDCCVVKVKEMTLNGQPVNLHNKRLLAVNGKVKKSADGAIQPTMVFATADPNINIRLERMKRLETNELHVRMEVTRIPETMAKDLI